MRFITSLLTGMFISRIIESKHRKVIVIFLNVLLSYIGIYTIYFNLKDFRHLTMTQIVGLIIITPMTLLFLLGIILIIYDSGDHYVTTLARNAGKIDEDHPMYEATYVGKTIFEEVECDVYIDNKRKCFLNNHVTGSKKYGDFYIRYIEPEELGEVYYMNTICHYKGYTFSWFAKTGGKYIVLSTMDYKLAEELDFKTVGRSEYELRVPMDEVKLEKEKVVVNMEKILNH